MLQRGLTARPGNRAVYIQSIAYPFRSTRLGYRELRMVVGQKGECSTWALVLVSNSGKRCYILIPSLLFGRTPNYRQPKNLSEDLVFTKYNGFVVVLLRVTTPTAAHTSAPVAASTGRVVGPQTAHPRGHIPCSALRGLGWGLGPGGSWQARLVPFRPVSTGYQP